LPIHTESVFWDSAGVGRKRKMERRRKHVSRAADRHWLTRIPPFGEVDRSTQ
jgi:hypothetical protein